MNKICNWAQNKRDCVYNSMNAFIKSATINRPWFSEFLNPAKFSKPYKKEAGKRIWENADYFLANYLLTELIILGIGM